MLKSIERWYSGKVCFLNNVKTDFRAEIWFDEYHQGNITIYGVGREVLLAAEHREYKSAVILLENKEYISVFDLCIKQVTSSTKIVDGKPVFDQGEIVMVSSVILRGNKYLSFQDTFSKLIIEITDGCELIGLCPYDINKNYRDISECKDINIPVQLPVKHIATKIGNFWFSVYPNYKWSRDSLTIGFTHAIQFKPLKTLGAMEIKETLMQVVSFFTLLSGESVTINRTFLMEDEDCNDDAIEYIGIYNFTKEKLHLLDNSGIDTTSFKRIALFKVSDFYDLENAMNYWFDHFDALLNAQKAYERILLDEELRVVTVGKFLAAMQLVEGYTQAYTDESQAIIDFEKRKQKILSELTEEEDIELVEKGLGFSGISFRKALKEYLYKGCSCLKEMSRRAFMDKCNKLIDRIVNDRNFYTHSSNRTTTQLSFDEMLNITTICKEIYRILILSEMGISHSLLIKRFSHNRINVAVFAGILGIEICPDGNIMQYDSDMWHFADTKQEKM